MISFFLKWPFSPHQTETKSQRVFLVRLVLGFFLSGKNSDMNFKGESLFSNESACKHLERKICKIPKFLLCNPLLNTFQD